MKKITMLFNPTAGTGNHSGKELASSYSGKDNRVDWYATDKEGWEETLEKKPDLLVIAGGDGTVQKVANALLKHERDIPARIHPIGTANNMARALDAMFTESTGNKSGPVQLDAGAVSGGKGPKFFVESMGIGVFPAFVHAIKEEDNTDSIKTDRRGIIQYFLRVVDEYQAKKTAITVDGIHIEGEFLMVQLFNIKFLGPNLQLAPAARPNDGYFDLLLVPADRKVEFKAFLTGLIHEKDAIPDVEQLGIRLQCKEVKIKSEYAILQIDDDIIDYSGEKLKVRMNPGRLRFYRNISL